MCCVSMCNLSLSFGSIWHWCSSNSLNSYVKSVNTVLFNLPNYFQKASSALRGHQTRFKVHIFITTCLPPWPPQNEGGFTTQRWKEVQWRILTIISLLMLVACYSNSPKSTAVICYADKIIIRWGRGQNSKIALFKVAFFTILKTKKMM